MLAETLAGSRASGEPSVIGVWDRLGSADAARLLMEPSLLFSLPKSLAADAPAAFWEDVLCGRASSSLPSRSFWERASPRDPSGRLSHAGVWLLDASLSPPRSRTGSPSPLFVPRLRSTIMSELGVMAVARRQDRLSDDGSASAWFNLRIDGKPPPVLRAAQGFRAVADILDGWMDMLTRTHGEEVAGVEMMSCVTDVMTVHRDAFRPGVLGCIALWQLGRFAPWLATAPLLRPDGVLSDLTSSVMGLELVHSPPVTPLGSILSARQFDVFGLSSLHPPALASVALEAGLPPDADLPATATVLLECLADTALNRDVSGSPSVWERMRDEADVSALARVVDAMTPADSKKWLGEGAGDKVGLVLSAASDQGWRPEDLRALGRVYSLAKANPASRPPGRSRRLRGVAD